jgi:hypothetical protein
LLPKKGDPNMAAKNKLVFKLFFTMKQKHFPFFSCFLVKFLEVCAKKEQI